MTQTIYEPNGVDKMFIYADRGNGIRRLSGIATWRKIKLEDWLSQDDAAMLEDLDERQAADMYETLKKFNNGYAYECVYNDIIEIEATAADARAWAYSQTA